ncbi:polyphenol oxidase family protein [Actinocorallia sp. A-T 12471]|uniref:polyphenol oxidase family protein n=1 Tax=Actinocorallia sp. A-T 12471 TaxID=3089813 RepID=UPI0029CB490E|nr:polyphenol oxidase family protein [Actinocorallia sp. A-T 12471]MDX6743577.1 polyphenol oxidase family protein [Actinocorallia sp. A-T 12471]
MHLADGVRTVVTDRTGGFSTGPYDSRNLGANVGDAPRAVARNRARTVAEIGAAGAVFMRQVHGTRVEQVTAPHDGVPDTDAVFTDVPGLALAALGADCPGVVVAGDGWVGAAHAGRAGTLDGVVPALVEAMRKAGAESLTALIGPGACGGCYEVPEEMRAASPPVMRSTTTWGTPALDLRAALTAQLADLGVPAVHDPRCTIETPELYSYRRDTTTGRFATFTWLT